MNKLLVAAALAVVTGSPAAASAQVAVSGGTGITVISGYNPNGPAGLLTAPVGGLENASITVTGPALLSATFLGYESGDADTFQFSSSNGPLSNQGPLGNSVTGITTSGPLNFTFVDTITGASVGNGGNGGPSASYAVLGRYFSGIFVPYTTGGYDLIIGFNQGPRAGADFDDLVVGLRLTALPAVPEPATWATMLMGLFAAGLALRRARTVARLPLTGPVGAGASI